MTEQERTLREFREYFAGAYEARGKLAARIGINHLTLSDVLAGSRKPMAKTLAKLRAFLDGEARRNTSSNGIRPTEPVPMKIVKPTRYSLYMRLCPFCRKARGKIQSISRKQFQGICPKCGASGPKRESEQLARRAWNWKESIRLVIVRRTASVWHCPPANPALYIRSQVFGQCRIGFSTSFSTNPEILISRGTVADFF
jgi:hypothetical protein